MNKSHFIRLSALLLLLGGLGANTAFSQVTIGSSDAPEAGTLLQLKDGTVSANGSNSKKGLSMPRVELQAYNKLQMGANATDLTYTGAADHVGLMVYNVNTSFNRCDPASIPSGFHVWNGAKWEGIGTPSHVSSRFPDLTISPYVYLTQPNTYMVTTVGSASSVTIPIAKAFAVWNYWSSTLGENKVQPRTFSGTLTTKIEWQEGIGQANDANKAILSGNPTLSSIAIADSLSATITVNTTGELGNAVVSLSDGSGEVLWSWHIWVTPPPAIISYNNNLWLDRNLGATSATPAANGTIGLYYQWGRNNPIPGYRTLGGVQSSVITSVELATAIADPANNGGTNSLAYAIKKPASFITSGSSPNDWYSTKTQDWNTRWSDQATDACNTTYDRLVITNPCPAGWKVPVGTSNGTVSPWGAGLTTSNGGTFSTNKGFNWITAPDNAGYYPVAGYRYFAGGMLDLGTSGFCWSSSPDAIYAYRLVYNNSAISPWINGIRGLGMTVRCVHE